MHEVERSKGTISLLLKTAFFDKIKETIRLMWSESPNYVQSKKDIEKRGICTGIVLTRMFAD